MIRLLIINPNTTASMTRDIARAARRAASPETLIVALNPEEGPASIQGPEDGEAALPGLFKTFDEAMSTNQFDAVIIACFDDTGIEELKARSPVPVLGIGEAAFHAATLLAPSFSTVTTLSVSVPIIEANIARYGYEAQSKKVRASEVPVLAIGEETAEAIKQEAQAALKEDGCACIVLGCAGMADLARALGEDLGVPVIDGVAAAVLLCETLTRMQAS